MSKKEYTAREAAQAVLKATHEMLQKSEKLAKYMTDMKAAPSKAKDLPCKAQERDFNEYNVKSGSSKDSSGPRLASQIAPTDNPKEQAEGNNKPDGMEPRYEFKDKVAAELAKENAAAKGAPKDKNGNPGLGKAEQLAKGDWAKIHSKLKREGYSEESADKIDGAIKAKLGKSAENPDKDADAQLGEKVEHDVEDHVKENEAAEAQEGNSMAKPGEKVEAAISAIPRLILSAKLSKFMEHMHSKRKNAEAQAPAAVGHDAANAPAPGSPDSVRAGK